MNEITFTPKIKLFVFLSAVFVATLLVGNLTGGKLFEISLLGYPFTLTVGMLSFPVTFLLTDVINEFYGVKAARFLTWVGFWVALGTFLLVTASAAIPIAEFTKLPSWGGVTEQSFNNIFTGAQRILAASMAAYLTAQFLDIAVFHAIKRLTNEKMLFLRATGSTLVSQLIDTVLIQFLAWYGEEGMSVEKILSLVVSGYIIKFLVAVSLTPVLYAMHALIEKTILKDEKQGSVVSSQ
jgi:uncharacterized integral membrane protein (TIGR00697 family)